MVRTLKVIPHAKILFLPSRDGVKDISDYITNGGDLHTLLQTARHFTSLEDVKSDRSKRLADWRATHFHDAYIKAFTKVVNHVERKAYDTDRITNAKLYPIPNLLEFSQNKTCCPFHNEKTPSLHYYAKTNSCYCFGGCGKAYDSISIYMKKFGVTFPEAIKQLNELV